MSDTNVAPGGGADAIVSVPVSTPATADTSPISATEAARQLAAFRWKRDNPEVAKTEEAQAAPEEAAAEPEPVSVEETDSAPPEEAPAETTPEADPVVEEQPSVEPPRSWPKDKKEAFKLLPPALQVEIADLERSREVEIRRGQNEVAEQRKAAEAAREAAEQERKAYAEALPALIQTLQAAQAGEFADIKTQDDVNRMANEDWPRFARWQAHRMQIESVEREAKAVQERQATEFKARWQQWSAKEDQKAIDAMPELSSAEAQSAMGKSVLATVKSVGFTEDEFGKAWTGEASINPRDSRWQQILVKAARFDQAKAGSKPAPKPVPPVQRPGVSKTPMSAADANIQNLQKAFDKNPTLKNATALRLAKSRAG